LVHEDGAVAHLLEQVAAEYSACRAHAAVDRGVDAEHVLRAAASEEQAWDMSGDPRPERTEILQQRGNAVAGAVRAESEALLRYWGGRLTEDHPLTDIRDQELGGVEHTLGEFLLELEIALVAAVAATVRRAGLDVPERVRVGCPAHELECRVARGRRVRSLGVLGRGAADAHRHAVGAATSSDLAVVAV